MIMCSPSPGRWTVQFCYLLFVAVNYYAQIHYAIPRLLYRKKYLLFLPLSTRCHRCERAVADPAGHLAAGPIISGRGLPFPDAGSIFRDSFLNIFIWVIFTVAIHQVIEKLGFRQYVDKMEKDASVTNWIF